MAKNSKKFIKPKDDWKKSSTGGKVVDVLGYLSVAGIVYNVAMKVIGKK